ncbi:LytTR family transcriptional regulator DNA-binding domain-containing protein [Spirosoma aerophilum]
MNQRKTQIHWIRPVAYVSGDANYTTLHYPDGSKLLVSMTIARVTSRLQLVRIHKQFAVNPAYAWCNLEAVVQLAGLDIKLNVARRRVRAVREALPHEPTNLNG